MKPRQWLDWRKRGRPTPSQGWIGGVVVRINNEQMVPLGTYRFVAISAFLIGIVIGVMIGASL